MSAPVQPGDVLLAKYRVERVLGQGGMGVVVAARHIDLGELFAIKFLLPAALAQPDAVERFLREARASARLKGEHVVKVQDVGRLPDGMPYMVMEHLSGSDLKDIVQQRGPLPIADAVTFVLQACDALAEAHALGIVHRDLKPANMFLTRRPNGSACVKVLDFGISKQVEPEKAEQHALTRTGMVLGSPIYMSPEQMMRTKDADPRGDIWSMGVVLYQFLTGTVPFLADVLTELVGKVLQEEPLPPSRHRPDIPPALDAVVMRCLQKRKEHRFQTVEQLIEAIQAAMAASGLPQGSGASMRGSSPALTPFQATPPAQAASPLQVAPPVMEQAPGAMIPPPAVSAYSGSGAPRPSLPSQPELAGGTMPLSVPAGSVSNTGPAAAAVTGPVVQTGQAWGTTGARPLPTPGPKRTGVLVGAAVMLFVLIGGGALTAWRYGGESSTAATGPSPSSTPPGLAGPMSDNPSSTATIAPPPAGPSAPPTPADTASGSPTTATTALPTVRPTTPATARPAATPTAKPTAKPVSSPSTTAIAPPKSLLGRD